MNVAGIAIGIAAALLVLAVLVCTVVLTSARPRFDWRPLSNAERVALFHRRYAANLVDSGHDRASLAEDVLQLQLIQLRRTAHMAMLEQEKPVRVVCIRRQHRATPVLTVVGAHNQAHREPDAAANRSDPGSQGLSPRAVRGSGATA